MSHIQEEDSGYILNCGTSMNNSAILFDEFNKNVKQYIRSAGDRCVLVLAYFVEMGSGLRIQQPLTRNGMTLSVLPRCAGLLVMASQTNLAACIAAGQAQKCWVIAMRVVACRAFHIRLVNYRFAG